jgi:alpha-L-fucosidase
VPYPCWGTFPYPAIGAGETARKEIAAHNFQLLKTGVPNGKYFMPAMSDAPLRGFNGRHEWFWEPGDEEHVYPLDNLMHMYYNSVGHNSSLILGLTPNADGLMPEPDVSRLKEFGDEIVKRFANPVVAVSGKGTGITATLPGRQTINHIVVEEEIANGERVRRFSLEGKTSKGWTTIFEGSCIGHKFIHRFDDMDVSAVRLHVMESKGEVQIKSMKVYGI